MSAFRAIGMVLLLTLTTAFVVWFVLGVVYVLAPIPEYQSSSWGDRIYNASLIGLPLGTLLGAIGSTCGVLSQKRPQLDYVLAGALGGLLAASGLILLFAVGDPASNPVVSFSGFVLGALIGMFRNKIWPDRAVRS
jgi:hypothetical protein